MNESTLTQLKTLVERAIRPVRASMSRKRKMQEELLAHVTTVFEEEARLGDEQAALERTAQRFGNPSELTGQLQQSVPTSDFL
jgi:ATP-dependent Clp protease ATP-binding subunit ClpC